MSETKDYSQFHVLNADGDFELNTHIEQDVSEIKRDNAAEADASNGFSDGRTMRKTASIAMVDYLNALKLGYELDAEDPATLQKELGRYLSNIGRAAGYQTVKHILTPGGNANIIIK